MTVFVISAPGESLRYLMLAAEELGYINGEYAFINMELFKSAYWGDHGWRRGDGNDTRARRAYEALITLSLYMPTDGHYFESFAADVKRRAKQDYSYDYADEEVMTCFIKCVHHHIARNCISSLN